MQGFKLLLSASTREEHAYAFFITSHPPPAIEVKNNGVCHKIKIETIETHVFIFQPPRADIKYISPSTEPPSWKIMEHQTTSTSPHVEANNNNMNNDKVLRSQNVVSMILDDHNPIIFDSRQERRRGAPATSAEEQKEDRSIRRQLPPSMSPPNKQEKSLSDTRTMDLTIPDLSESESASEEKWVLSRSLAWSQDSMDVPPSSRNLHARNFRFQRNHSMLIDSSRTESGEVSPTSTCLYWEEKLEQAVPFPEY
jgi:hypothetical protein